MQGVKLENNIIIIRLPQAEKILLSIRETWKYRKIQANQSVDIESVTPLPSHKISDKPRGGGLLTLRDLDHFSDNFPLEIAV